MKNSVKIFVGLIACAVIASCSDWVKPEPLTVKTNDVKNLNPELYEAYCESVRDYKKNDSHKIVYAIFDNSYSSPSNASQSLSYVPDSVDVIELLSADMYEWTVSEMEEIRNTFGTRFVTRFSYVDTKTAYDEMEDKGDYENFEDYYNQRFEQTLSFISKYKLDGFTFVYEGKLQDHLKANELSSLKAEQDKFLAPVEDWVESRGSKLFYFQGTPMKLLPEHRDFALAADAIILPTYDSHAIQDFDYAALQAAVDEFADCEYFFEVATLPFEEGDMKTGRFYEGPSIPIAGRWFLQDDGYGFRKAGLVVWNIERDCLNPGFFYPNLRGAIKNMNPNS